MIKLFNGKESELVKNFYIQSQNLRIFKVPKHVEKNKIPKKIKV
jgi:hypothetical protein